MPAIEAALAERLAQIVATLRTLELKKSPSIAETIDWANTLLALGLDHLDEDVIGATLGVVLKHHSDQERARRELDGARLDRRHRLSGDRPGPWDGRPRVSLLDRHLGFVRALREAELPVSPAEGLDAARALEVIDLTERESLRAAYAATLVKRPAHRAGLRHAVRPVVPRLRRAATGRRGTGPRTTTPTCGGCAGN